MWAGCSVGGGCSFGCMLGRPPAHLQGGHPPRAGGLAPMLGCRRAAAAACLGRPSAKACRPGRAAGAGTPVVSLQHRRWTGGPQSTCSVTRSCHAVHATAPHGTKWRNLQTRRLERERMPFFPSSIHHRRPVQRSWTLGPRGKAMSIFEKKQTAGTPVDPTPTSDALHALQSVPGKATTCAASSFWALQAHATCHLSISVCCTHPPSVFLQLRSVRDDNK